MKVKSATLRGDIGFVNSAEDYKDPKNVLVFLDKTAVTKFKEAKIDDLADHFRSKTIEVHGKVELYHGRPEIKVASPEQIKIVEGK